VLAIENQLRETQLELRQLENSRDEMRRQVTGEAPLVAGGPEIPVNQPNSNIPTEFDARIEANRQRLDEMMLRFTEAHPDVLGIKRVIAELERQRDAAQKKAQEAMASAGAGTMVNPVFRELRIALADAEAKVA